MSDDFSSSEVAILVLGKEQFDTVRPALDEDARIVEIDVALGIGAAVVDISLPDWTWPDPVGATLLTIRQPNARAFQERLQSLNVDVVLDAEFLEAEVTAEVSKDEEEGQSGHHEPGRIVEGPCPACGYPELVVADVAVQREMISMVSRVLNTSYEAKPCSEHGAHYSLGGNAAHVIRCCDCLQAFLVSTYFENGIVKIGSEN